MMTMKQEARLINALPDFTIYHKARYVGENVEVHCGRYEIPKVIRKDKTYTGEFIVFPEACICNVLTNAYAITKPTLWEFIEDEDDEDY